MTMSEEKEKEEVIAEDDITLSRKSRWLAMVGKKYLITEAGGESYEWV